MALTSNLIDEFVKATLQDNSANSKGTSILRGTVRIVNGAMYTVIDGSEILTPVKTTVAAKDGDRVEVRIYNHTATITGNLTDVSVGKVTVDDIVEKAFDGFVITNSNFIDGTIDGSIFQDGTVTGSKIDFSTFENGVIDGSVIKNSSITGTQIANSTIKDTNIVDSTITGSKIANATIEASHITDATFDKIKGDSIDAVKADIDTIISDSATINTLKTEIAKIENIESEYAKIDFANVDVAHIDEAWIQDLMVQGKIIAQEGTIFYLDAVEINADKITAGTLKADRLLLSGKDGLFYEINASVDGVTAEELETEEYQNQLHGGKIIAKTITADKITVSDLSALQATIGGWHILSDSLYSGTRSEFEKEGTLGAYLGSNGQVDIGTDTEYVRFDPTTGNLKISAKSLSLNAVDISGSIDDLSNQIKANSTAITQTGNIVEIGFIEIGEQFEANNKEWGELRSYIRFVDGNMELGKASNDFKAILTNSELAFQDHGEVVSYLNNQKMHITKAEIVDYLSINNWKFKQRPNGNLSLKWRPGEI